MTESITRFGADVLTPLVDPGSRTFVPFLVIAMLIACVFHKVKGHGGGWRAALGVDLWRHASSILDAQLFVTRQLLRVLGVIPVIGGAVWLAVKTSTNLDAVFGIPSLEAPTPWVLSLGYSLVLFVLWDLSRFITHLALHKIPFLWAFHQVHHSGEVLTPLTFHRTHPVESIIYGIRGVVSTGLMAGVAFWLFRGQAAEYTILGVHGLGLVFTAVTGNLRHSHVWIRFPDSVERWLMSPAQHQLHHSLDARHFDANYGTWLAVWDRSLGSLRVSPHEAIAEVGLADPNHNPHDLFSVLFAPFVDALSSLRWVRAAVPTALLLLTTAGVAHAEEAEDDSTDGTMIITADSGTTRVAGAAHVIDEKTLEKHEYTDIHQVLATVPGVYLRDEDGFGLRPNIGLRGGNSDRSAKITLLEDGAPLSPAPYAAPAAYYFPMTMRIVGVEVIKGAAAIRHGPQTIGGAINLRTRRVPVDATIGEIDAAYGAFNTVKAHGFTGYGTDQWGVLGEVAHHTSDGFKVLDGGGPTGFLRQDAMLKGRWSTDLTESVINSIEVKLGHGREVSDETYLGLTASDFESDPNRRYSASANDRMEWNRQGASLTWRLLAGENWDLRTTVYHHRLDRTWFKVNGFADGTSMHDLLYAEPDGGQGAAYLEVLRGVSDTNGVGDRILKGGNDRQFQNTGVASVGHWRAQFGDIQNEIEVGVRWHKDDVKRHHTQRSFDMVAGSLQQAAADRETTLDSHNDATAIAVHIHDDFRVGQFTVLPGVRYERITTRTGTRTDGPQDPQTHSIWLPGLGVHVQIIETVSVFGGTHKGFSPIPPGSPDETVPETAWNHELGARYTDAQTKLEAVGFYSAYENMTGQCTLSGGCTDAQLDTQFNGGEAIVRGVETSGKQLLSVGGGWNMTIDASYAWTDARFAADFLSKFPQFGAVESGDLLPYVPVHQGSGAVGVEHDRGQLTARLSGRSGMRNAAGSEDEPEAQKVAAHHSLDIAAQFNINEHFTLYGNVTNLTDKQTIASWRPFGARPTHPRKWMVGLKAKL